MAGDVVGRATYETLLDRTGLKEGLDAAHQDVVERGQQTEQAANASVERSTSKWGKLGQAGVAAIAGTGVVAFGLMTRGALQADRAQADFQAQTGRSREEAQAFTRDMNGLAGTASTVGRSFEEITATGTEVASQFGLVGAEGTRLTSTILAYARVVRADGVTSTQELEDTLSAFNEDAERGGPLLDQLIASHQKFGTDAGPRSLAVLRGMAPALQAANADLDDGIALLNLFEVAGLDAGSAQRALNKAVQDLKPGESLDDLIARIGAIEDPTLRAQAAIDIFGARSGVGLANAIKPGMTSLDEFGLSAQEAAGRVDDAAEDMQTFPDKIRGIFDKVMAGARDVGSQFGPALMGLSTLGSLTLPFVTKIGGFLKDAGIKLLPNAKLAGLAVGIAQGAGHVEGATSTSVVGALAARISGMQIPLEASGKTVGMAVGTAMAGGILAGVTGAGLAALIQEQLTNLDVQAGGVDIFPRDMWQSQGELAAKTFAKGYSAEVQAEWAHIYAQTIRDSIAAGTGANRDAGVAAANAHLEGLRSQSNAWRAGYTEVQAQIAADARPTWVKAGLESAEGWRQGYGQVQGQIAAEVAAAQQAAAERGSEAFGERWVAMGLAQYNQWAAPFRALGAGIPGEIGQGIQDQVTAPLDALGALREILKTGLTPDEVAAKVVGKKYVQLVERGLESGIPGARETAQQVAAAAIDALETAGFEGPKGKRNFAAVGRYYDDLLASGLTAAQARVVLTAGDVSDATIARLEAGKDGARAAGTETSEAYAGGLLAKVGARITSFSTINASLLPGTVSGAASSVRAGASTVLSNTQGFHSYGSGVTGEYAGGILAGKGAAVRAAEEVLRAVRSVFRVESPPESPIIRPARSWGRNLILEHAGGMREGVGVALAVAGSYVGQLGALLSPAVTPQHLSPEFASAFAAPSTATLRHEHVVHLDLRNAPEGVTNEGVARIVTKVLGADAFAWQLEHAMSVAG